MLVRLTSDRQDSWEEMLPHSILAYRSTVHRGTGFTPYRLLFGRELKLPLEVKWGLPDYPRTTDSYSVQLAANLSDAYERASEAAHS